MSKKKERSTARLVGHLLLGIVFTVGAVIGLGYLASRLIIPSDWGEATGHLTSVDRDYRRADQLTTYDRTYSFDVDGITYTATSKRYSEGELGSTAPIRYDPADPDHAEVVGFWDRFILYLTGLGVLLLLVGSALSLPKAVNALRKRQAS